MSLNMFTVTDKKKMCDDGTIRVTQALGKEKKRWGPVEALVHFQYDPVTEDEALTAESRAVLLHSLPVSMSSTHVTSR